MAIVVNKPLPEFEAMATGGVKVSNSSHLGQAVVLYFYPKDNTPGCTTQGQNFRDAHEAFRAAGCEIVGISRDSIKSHENFRAKQGFPFDLLSDAEEVACNLFGVIKMKSMYGKQVRGIERSTFVVDGKGVLRGEWRGVKVPGHVDEVLAFVQSL